MSGSVDKAGKARDAKETRSAPAKPKRVTGATPKRASTARAAPRAKAAAERDRQPSPPARGKRGRFGAPTEEMPPDTARWEEPGAAPGAEGAEGAGEEEKGRAPPKSSLSATPADGVALKGRSSGAKERDAYRFLLD